MPYPKTIIFGSDHGGYEMKQVLIAYLNEKFSKTNEKVTVEVQDEGCWNGERCDYPEFGRSVANKVSKDPTELIPSVMGIVVCGSGIGISIAANKVNGVRCAVCHDHYTAKMSRQHNNANILALGGRSTGIEVAKEIVDVFLSTPFEGGRHLERVKMIHEVERTQQANEEGIMDAL